MVTVTYQIPIVQKKRLTHWIFMSVPDNAAQVIQLSNEKYFQKLAVDNNNLTYANITDIDKLLTVKQ